MSWSIFKPTLLLSIACIMISIYALFAIKYQVQQSMKILKKVEQEINQEQENIHILKAELAYLKAPKRIKEITDNYLNLIPIKKNKIVYFKIKQ